jgi:hypothetical protein
MRDMLLTAWKWVAVAALLAAIGLLMATGFGKRRNSAAYRARMAMWTLVLGLLGLGAVGAAGCNPAGGDKDAAADVTSSDGSGQPEYTCYAAPAEEMRTVQDQKGEMSVECYAALPPDVVEVQGPTCYADVQEWVETPDVTGNKDASGEDASVLLDMAPTCYLVALDMLPQDAAGQDMQPMCYDPAMPDVAAPEAGGGNTAADAGAAQDVKPELFAQCYDSAPVPQPRKPGQK